jgi:2-polyprenyl-6-methoxyphenol hydroxylase-like FAD-dependent oxidoreductase
MGKTVDSRPRAAHYAAPAALELLKAGVLEDVKKRGFQPEQFCWRKLDGTWLTGIDNRVIGDDPLRMVVLPLGLLGELLVEHAEKYPNIKIHWAHEVVAIDQDEHKARAVAKTEDGIEITFEGDYVVGCDGANSKVRRALFGDWNYPGKTWDEWVVATNVSIHAASEF